MTLRHLHVFEPDADGDCYRCEFPADETEVHVPAGEEIVAFVEPFGVDLLPADRGFTSFREDAW